MTNVYPHPHPALSVVTPDEAAETWDGIEESLYQKLWSCVEKYDNTWRENIEDIGPHDVIGINSVSKFWRHFTEEERRHLNQLARRNSK